MVKLLVRYNFFINHVSIPNRYITCWKHFFGDTCGCKAESGQISMTKVFIWGQLVWLYAFINKIISLKYSL